MVYNTTFQHSWVHRGLVRSGLISGVFGRADAFLFLALVWDVTMNASDSFRTVLPIPENTRRTIIHVVFDASDRSELARWIPRYLPQQAFSVQFLQHLDRHACRIA